MMTTTTTECRVCPDHVLLDPVYSLGTITPSTFLAPAADTPASLPPTPLDLACCPMCTLVQLRHTLPAEALFRQYWYQSGINETMRAELDDIVRAACLRVPVNAADAVLDIGANDGTLLSHYLGYPPRRLAFEPAYNLHAALDRHTERIFPTFFPPQEIEAVRGLVSLGCKHIFAIAMFYDLANPNAFVYGVKQILHPDGVWIVQLQDLAHILETTAFDCICLPEGDPVITTEGLKAIDQVRSQDRVLTHRGRFRPVTRTHRREYVGDLVELQAYAFGHVLRVTPEHPILVKRKQGWCWCKAKAVKRGDVVAKPVVRGEADLPVLSYNQGHGRGKPTTHALPVTEGFLRVAGWYLAEGSVGAEVVTFYFGRSMKEQRLARRCLAIIRGLGFTARLWTNRTSTCVSSPGPLMRLLKLHFGAGAENKRIPEWALRLPPASTRCLIEAYIEGDGYTYRKNYWRASTVSQELAHGVALLANRVGWKVVINRQRRPETCTIEGRTVNQRPLWDILIPRRPRRNSKSWMEEEYQAARVRVVRRTPYSGYVYNLEVAEDNTYVSPAMVVHNCHEHIEYYSLHALQQVLRHNALAVYDVEPRAINGGSIRCYVGHAERRPPWASSAGVDRGLAQLRHEDELGLLDPETLALRFRQFGARVTRGAEHVQALLDAARQQGTPVDGYGASTKGNTLLQVYGLDASQIRQIAERSPAKVGMVTAATRIPIVSEATWRADPAPVTLVPIWQFRDAVLRREAAYLQGGGQFLFPLPTAELVEGTT